MTDEIFCSSRSFWEAGPGPGSRQSAISPEADEGLFFWDRDLAPAPGLTASEVGIPPCCPCLWAVPLPMQHPQRTMPSPSEVLNTSAPASLLEDPVF